MDAETFRSLPVAALLTRGGVVVAANGAYEAMVGLPAASLVGRAVSDLVAERIDPPDAEAVTRASAARSDGSILEGTLWCRVIDASGRRRAVRVLWWPTPRDPAVGVVLLLDDGGATEAKEAAEALALAASDLSAAQSEDELLERAADALAARGFTVTFLLIDEGDPLLRYGPTRSPLPRVATPAFEATRLPRTILSQLNPRFDEGRAAFLQPLRSTLDRAYGDAAVVREIEAARPGRFVMQAPLFVSGAAYGAIVLTSDALSPALAGAAEVFAALVARAIENVRMQQVVLRNERLAAIGEAAAVMAHEVRNPVGALMNAVALLRRGEGDRSELLDMIRDEANTLEHIVSDLLALGRPITPRIARHDLRDTVTRAIEVARMRNPTAAIRLHAAEPRVSSFDPDLVQLAVYNVLRNALQASPDTRPIDVFLEAVPLGSRVRIDDHGPGIPSAIARRVVEPFFTTRASGTGIGLAAVRRIVEACGGVVEIGATEDDGGRVSLSFPG